MSTGSPHPDHVLHLVARTRDHVHRELAAELERRGLDDIAPAHAGVIFVLSTLPQRRASMSELAALLDRDNSTITTLVDRLRKLGYVQKRRSDEDGRAFTVELGAPGLECVSTITAASRSVRERFFAGFSTEERQTLTRLLDRTLRNLKS